MKRRFCWEPCEDVTGTYLSAAAFITQTHPPMLSQAAILSQLSTFRDAVRSLFISNIVTREAMTYDTLPKHG